MIDEEISNLTVIDALIRKKRPFVVYRIPGEKLPPSVDTGGGDPFDIRFARVERTERICYRSLSGE